MSHCENWLCKCQFCYWKFPTRLVAILEPIRNSRPYWLFPNGRSEGPRLNCISCIAEIILRVKILNLKKKKKKSIFVQKYMKVL